MNDSTSTTGIDVTATSFDAELHLQLSKPISIGEQNYESITLTEPTVGQLIEAGKATGPLAQIAKLINLNGKVPESVVNKMLQRDFQKAADFFGHFSS